MKLVRDPRCHDCGLCKTAEFVCLLGEGPKNTPVMIIGEAPGHREDASGKPFVGNAGELLDEMLEHVGIDRADVYITNAVHCRPLNNRTPSKREINACKRWLMAEIKAVRPKFVLTLGNTPLFALFGKTGIKKLRGMPIEQDGIVFYPTFHPSYILHAEQNGDLRARHTLELDFEMFFRIVQQGGIGVEKGLDYRIVTDATLGEAFDDIRQSCVLSLDTETTGLNQFEPGFRIVSVGFGTEKHQWCFPLTHRKGKLSSPKSVMARLDKIVRGKEIVAHNGKFDTLGMAVVYGVWWYVDFDTMLAHYMLDENSYHDLKLLAQKYYGAVDYDIPIEEKHGDGPIDRHCKYLALDLYYTRKLRFEFAKRLDADPPTRRVFDLITMPVARMYADIEYHGVWANKKQLEIAHQQYQAQADKAWARLNKLCPHPELKWKDKNKQLRVGVNWGSTQQVAEVLFGELGLTALDKTAKGADSTSESVLLRLVNKHEVPKLILAWREAIKNIQFCDQWKYWLINNRIHPSFKVHGTVTGRPSCESPNFQQVPRNPILRSVFSAPRGYVMIEVDESQAEMRIAAHMADERAMKFVFQTGGDIHIKTAQEVIGIANPNADERKKTKAVGFGYLFGMSWPKFIIYARDKFGIDFSPREARDGRKRFFRTYPGLLPFHDKQRKLSRINGYVRTLTGRKRRLPAAMEDNDSPECREAQRQAINSPIQGFVAELNLMGMLAIHGDYTRRPNHKKYRRPRFEPEVFHFVGSVHDAALGEARLDRKNEVIRELRKAMENPPLFKDFGISLTVPLVAEAKIGPWGAPTEEIKYAA